MSTQAALKPLHELESIASTTITSLEQNGFMLSKPKLMALLVSENAPGCNSIAEYKQRLIIQKLQRDGKGALIRAITTHIGEMLSNITSTMMPENRSFYEFIKSDVWRHNTFHDARYDAADELIASLLQDQTPQEYRKIAQEILAPLSATMSSPDEAWKAAVNNAIWALLNDLKAQLDKIQPKLRKFFTTDDPFGSISDCPDFQAALEMCLSNVDWITEAKPSR